MSGQSWKLSTWCILKWKRGILSAGWLAGGIEVWRPHRAGSERRCGTLPKGASEEKMAVLRCFCSRRFRMWVEETSDIQFMS